jgi:hypothetical protein
MTDYLWLTLVRRRWSGSVAERIVLVEWEDANTHHEWHTNDTLLIKPSLCRHAGFVIEETDEALTLTMGFDSQVNHVGSRSCTLAIPRSAIRKVTELRRGKR